MSYIVVVRVAAAGAAAALLRGVRVKVEGAHILVILIVVRA